MNESKPIVLKRADGQNPKSVRCTTYQMRNVFRQLGDGVATELEMMNWFQHAAAADLCRKGARVLDVCCGRGLLIPFLRYRAKPNPSIYVGVDIEPKNAKWASGKDPRRETRDAPDWGFPVVFVESDVATMSQPIRQTIGSKPFDVVVYTAAIEHMQPSAQAASLVESRKVTKRGGQMYLSCPLTRHGDGWNVQYAAHLYEPSMPELKRWLMAAGWKIDRTIGLVTKSQAFRRYLTGTQLSRAEAIYAGYPREQALTMIAALYPQSATEVALICTAV